MNGPVSDVGRLDDVVERPFTQHRVRPHPEGGVVVRHALVGDVLNIGGRPRDALEGRGGAGEGTVGTLGHRHVGVLCLLHEIDQTKAVLGQDDRVSVQGHDVVSVRNLEAPSTGSGGKKDATGHGLHVVVRVAHQADVGVEVHRLVGLVRQIGVELPFERRHVRSESPGQPTVELVKTFGR